MCAPSAYGRPPSIRRMTRPNASTCSTWPERATPRLAVSGDPRPATAPRTAVLTILAGMAAVPAYVRNLRMDILAANPLCQALYGGALDDQRLPLNLARYVFLDPHSRGFFLGWDGVADDLVGTGP
jgi:hypothetical protein